MPADHFVEMMIDGAEEPAPPIAVGVEPSRVGAHITSGRSVMIMPS